MGKPNFSDEFKRGAVAQITEHGYMSDICIATTVIFWFNQ